MQNKIIKEDIVKEENAEVRLKASEEKFRRLFETAQDGILLIDFSTGMILDVNKFLIDLLGYSKRDFLEKHLWEVGVFKDVLASKANFLTLQKKRYVRFEDLPLETKTGKKIDVEFVANAYPVGGKRVIQCNIRDITERKRAEMELQKSTRARYLLSLSNKELVRATEENALLQAVCRLAVEQGDYVLAWVGFAEQDENKSVRPVAQAGFEKGYLDKLNISWADVERGRGPTGTAIRTCQPVLVRNTSTDPAFGPWRKAALQHGYASSIALPMQEGKYCFGALNLYAAQPDAFDSDEVRMLTELASDLAYGIGALRHQAERKKAEAALRESEYFFKESQRAAFIGSYKTDFIKGMWESSEVLDQIFGIDDSYQRSVQNWLEIVHQDDRKMMGKYLSEEILKKHKHFNKEYRITRKSDGQERWVLGLGKVGWDKRGKAISMIGTIQDITERKKAEAALRESEDKFAKIFQTSPYSITLSVLEDGRFIEVNDAFTAITGFSQKEAFLKSSLKMRIWVNKKARDQVMADLHAGKPVLNREILFRRKDGEEFPGLYSAKIINMGQETCLLSIVQDITELKKAEDALLEVEELKGLDIARTNFLNMVSHELKTPLTAIYANLELLEGARDNLSPNHVNNINAVRRNSNQLRLLIENILEISRIQSNKFEVSLSQVDLDSLLGEITNDFRLLADKKRIQLTIEGDKQIRLNTDRQRLSEILTNLIDNAIKLTDVGYVKIKVAARKEGCYVEVSDTGIGIPENKKAKIFEKFYQVSTPLKSEVVGTGLGLSITKQLVELLGGSIGFRSEFGKGSVFYFTLPLNYPGEAEK